MNFFDDDFFIKDLRDIKLDNLLSSKLVIMGLDVGDKTVGISVSDLRIKIASSVSTIIRKRMDPDCKAISDLLKKHNVGLVIFGWPLQMDGFAGDQCSKILDFIKKLHDYVNIDFAKWDERFSTKIVDRIMIDANISRSKRKKIIDKTSAVYILQGAIDFLNKNTEKSNLLTLHT